MRNFTQKGDHLAQAGHTKKTVVSLLTCARALGLKSSSHLQFLDEAQLWVQNEAITLPIPEFTQSIALKIGPRSALVPKVDTVYLIHHSHTDIGFTHDQPILWELQARFIDQALDTVEHYAGDTPTTAGSAGRSKQPPHCSLAAPRLTRRRGSPDPRGQSRADRGDGDVCQHHAALRHRSQFAESFQAAAPAARASMAWTSATR